VTVKVLEALAACSKEFSLLQWGIVIVGSLVGARCDVRTGRIPNWLTMPMASLGFAYMAWRGGLYGLGDSAVGWFALALPYIVLFVLARGGAGDAKMMGAVGAWLGVQPGLIVLVCVGAAGAVFALARMLAHGRRRMLGNLWASLYVFMVALCGGHGGWRPVKDVADQAPATQANEGTVPYGVPIFLGVCMGAILVHIWIKVD
jgi:Flp pilus assembly protein protease CpaA